MELFEEFLLYLRNILQSVIDLITSNWLTSTFFGFNIIYLTIVAVKLKRNTD